MITEHDIQEAIAECNGERNPNANTCIKLAAFLTIKREMFGSKDEEQPLSYSYSAPPIDKLDYDSGTEFSNAIQGVDINYLIPIVDELMSALQVTNPRLYAGVIRRIKE